MRQRIREIREDLNKVVHDLIELEVFMRDVQSGKVEPPKGWPRRSFTATGVLRTLELPQAPLNSPEGDPKGDRKRRA